MAKVGDPADRREEPGRESRGEQTKGKAKEASEQVREKAQETTEQVQEKAVEARARAGDRIREQVSTRSTQAGEQVSSVADAIRRTGEQLRSEGKEGPAKISEQAAERAERLGGYLRESDADRILGDAEAFARRRPWVVGAGGLVVGFLASRFLKASSSRRYQSASGEASGEFPSRVSREYGEEMPPALPRGTAREPVGVSAEWSRSRPAEARVPLSGGPGDAPEF